jgi:hypothetical protein
MATKKKPDNAKRLSRPTWTVMIYMAGDNNLTEECIYGLTEMKRAIGTDNNYRVFVQFDPKDDLLPVQRYRINRSGNPNGPVADDLFDWVRADGRFQNEGLSARPLQPFTKEKKERPGEGFSGDPAALYNFVAYCMEQSSSDYYCLVICGHGAGIQRDYLLKDESPEGYLTLAELRKALRWVRDEYNRTIDIFGMDVCLMSMAEVAYSLRHKVKIAIGCPSYAPASGWPYKQVLEAMMYRPRAMQAKQAKQANAPEDILTVVARRMVYAYMNYYVNYSLGGLSVTQSALDIRHVDELNALILRLADDLTEALKREFAESKTRTRNPSLQPITAAIVLAHWEAQSYNGELYTDIVDFVNCLRERLVPLRGQSSDKVINDLVRKLIKDCQDIANFIPRFVIASSYHGRQFQWSYGLSIYFPWDLVVPYYSDAIKFPYTSHWMYFLAEYTKDTRRPPRVNRLFDENYVDVRMGPDKMGPDKSWIVNPIHSMRNPPLVYPADPNVTGAEDTARKETDMIAQLTRR